MCRLRGRSRHRQRAQGFHPRENAGPPPWVQEPDGWVPMPASPVALSKLLNFSVP